MKKTKRAKYLIETSSIPAALEKSTPAHNRHFAELVKGGDLFSSFYIRMEFIRRWFCDAARVAFTIDQCTSVSHALVVLAQDFRPRNIKGTLAVMAERLSQRGTIQNSRDAAVEIASDAIGWLKLFDKVFAARISNTCGCQIGSRTPKVDYNNLMADLRRFYLEFLTPVTDCEVNSFLNLSGARSRARRILEDTRASELKSSLALRQIKDEEKWITCKECKRIGDAIIALEQPPSWCIVHVDNAFDDLCRVLDRQHKLLKSVVAVEQEGRTT